VEGDAPELGESVQVQARILADNTTIYTTSASGAAPLLFVNNNTHPLRTCNLIYAFITAELVPHVVDRLVDVTQDALNGAMKEVPSFAFAEDEKNHTQTAAEKAEEDAADAKNMASFAAHNEEM